MQPVSAIVREVKIMSSQQTKVKDRKRKYEATFWEDVLDALPEHSNSVASSKGVWVEPMEALAGPYQLLKMPRIWLLWRSIQQQ